MKINCDFVDLRLIVHIMETSSLTLGAQRCHLSPPAASARLKKVQESLGQALFARTATGLAPTAASHTFVRHARTILDQLEQLQRDMRSQTALAPCRVRLYVTPLSINGLVRNAVETFMIAHPEINFDLHERSSKDIAKALKAQQADVGVFSLNDLSRDDQLIYHPLKSEELVLITPPEHPLAADGSVEFSRALRYDFVALHDKSPFHHFTNDTVNQENGMMRVRIQSQSFESLCNLVAAGVGIALIPLSEAQHHADRFRYRTIQLQDHWAIREPYIVVHRDKQLSPAIVALLDWVLHAQEGLTTGAEPPHAASTLR